MAIDIPQSVDEALQYAIGIINRGDAMKGRAALSWVLKQDPENAVAWLWMSCCVDDERAKEECYRRVSMFSS